MIKLPKRCPHCMKTVDENKQLFVEDDKVLGILYHLSCYNYKKAEEDNE